MMDLVSECSERRKYQRCYKTICKAVVSIDGLVWHGIDICDISYGGLRFISKIKYDNNTNLKFDLFVYCFLSEFNLKIEGNIVWSRYKKYETEYAVKFYSINQCAQIQLDEIIKSKVKITNVSSFSSDNDGNINLLNLRRRTLGYKK